MQGQPMMPAFPSAGGAPHPGAGGRAHLYVGNLSPRVTEPILADIFATAGPILGVKLIPDRNFQHGGLNYGFVEYHDLPSAERAINTLNGRRIFETEIKVNWAYQNVQAKEDLSQHFHVFVGDLSPEITDDTLKKAFSAFGSLTDARVMWDVATGKSRGYGFLAFRDKPDADQAIAAMNGEWLGSRAIRVNWANQRMGAGGQMEVGTGVAGGPMRISNLPPFLGPPGSAAAQQAAALAALDPDAEPQAGNYQQLIGGQAAHMGPLPAHMRHLVNMHANKPLNFEVVLQQAPPSNTTVYVGNLSPQIQASDIMPLFQGFGYIPEIKVQGDKGYAFVKLDTHHNAAQAIVNVNGSMLRGRQIRCNWGREKLGSDTSIIANQANGVTSETENGSENVVPEGGYAGWSMGLPAGQKKKESEILPGLSSAQASYYAQYYKGGMSGLDAYGIPA